MVCRRRGKAAPLAKAISRLTSRRQRGFAALLTPEAEAMRFQ